MCVCTVSLYVLHVHLQFPCIYCFLSFVQYCILLLLCYDLVSTLCCHVSLETRLRVDSEHAHITVGVWDSVRFVRYTHAFIIIEQITQGRANLCLVLPPFPNQNKLMYLKVHCTQFVNLVVDQF